MLQSKSLWCPPKKVRKFRPWLGLKLSCSSAKLACIFYSTKHTLHYVQNCFAAAHKDPVYIGAKWNRSKNWHEWASRLHLNRCSRCTWNHYPCSYASTEGAVSCNGTDPKEKGHDKETWFLCLLYYFTRRIPKKTGLMRLRAVLWVVLCRAEQCKILLPWCHFSKTNFSPASTWFDWVEPYGKGYWAGSLHAYLKTLLTGTVGWIQGILQVWSCRSEKGIW